MSTEEIKMAPVLSLKEAMQELGMEQPEPGQPVTITLADGFLVGGGCEAYRAPGDLTICMNTEK